MDSNLRKRSIILNPHEVRDETVAALEAEIREQAHGDFDNIETIQTVVLDTDSGLDSHATIFVEGDNNE